MQSLWACIRVNVISWDGYCQFDDSEEIRLRKTDCISVHFTDCFRWPGLVPSEGRCPGANEDFLARGRWPRSRNASVRAESRSRRRARWDDLRFLQTRPFLRFSIHNAYVCRWEDLCVSFQQCELTVHFWRSLYVEVSVCTALLAVALCSGLITWILCLPVLVVHASTMGHALV